MKQRIISGTLCVVVLAIVLCFYNTLVLEAAISALAAIAVFELLTAAGFRENKPFLYTGVVAATVVPYAHTLGILPFVIAAFLVAVVVLLLRFHSKLGFEKLSFLVVATLGVSLAFNCIVALRDMSDKVGLFYILVAFGGAWFADTGAYFTGMLLGKHKLSPVISPKKTVEGAVGGVVWNVGLLCLLAFVYTKIYASAGTVLTVSYLNIAILAVAVAFAGMAGDLVASVIKRQIGIKDYGKLIPGHGGIMDRFDSILFTSAAVYFVVQYVTVIS